MTKFTNDELLELLLQTGAEPAGEDGAYTTRDLVRITGRSNKWILEKVRTLIENGEWECVKSQRADITGTMRPVSAYRPVKKD